MSIFSGTVIEMVSISDPSIWEKGERPESVGSVSEEKWREKGKDVGGKDAGVKSQLSASYLRLSHREPRTDFESKGKAKTKKRE